MNPIYHICRCMPNILYIMGSDFMRYNTRIKISHGCRFHEIFHQNQNISFLIRFLRYYARTTISHGCTFREILLLQSLLIDLVDLNGIVCLQEYQIVKQIFFGILLHHHGCHMQSSSFSWEGLSWILLCQNPS